MQEEPLSNSDRQHSRDWESWERVTKDPVFQRVLTDYLSRLAQERMEAALANKEEDLGRILVRRPCQAISEFI